MKLLVLGEFSSYLYQLLEKTGNTDAIVAPFFKHHNHKPSMVQIREARPAFLALIKKYPKHTILGLGGIALKFILDAGGQSSVASYRGRPVTIADTKRQCYVTYDPASLGHGNTENEALITEDLVRFRLPLLPWPANKLPTGNTWGIDTEYTNDGTVLDVAVADSSRAYRVDPRDARGLAPIFKVKTFVGHVIGGDLTSLVRLGCTRNDWAKGENIYDSFIIARMADENRGRGNYTVDALLLAKHNVKGWKHKTEAFSSGPSCDATQWPADLRAERCRLDAWATYHNAMDWRDAAEGPIELQCKIAVTLERVKLAGAYVDMNAYYKWTKEVQLAHVQQLEVLTKIAHRRGMKEFSPTKPNDIRTLFYTKMRLTIEERTPKGLPSVGKSFLYRYKNEIPEVAEVLNFRKLDKTLTTYVTGIRTKIVKGEHGYYIPFRLGAMGTRTARRAADRPNSQNWPKAARAIVYSRYKNGYILDNDFSKLEIILLAHEAQDQELMRYFTREKNGYISIATKLFNKTVEEGTSEYRQVKAVVLGVNYNLRTFGLARQLWDLHGVRLASRYDDHVDAVDAVRTRYLRMFPKISAYQRERVHEVHKYGSALCWFGQLRRLPIPPEPARSEGKETWKKWKRQVSHLENEAINARIQNAASYVCGTAMLDCESALLGEYGLTHIKYHKALALGHSTALKMPILINEVHDDLVFDCPAKAVKKAQGIIKECMTKLVTLRKLLPDFDAPVRVSQQASRYWGKNDG